VYFIGHKEWFILRTCLEAKSVEVKCLCCRTSANSLELRHSWESDRHLPIPYDLHSSYCFHKSSPLDPTLYQDNLVHNLASCLFRTNFNVIFRSMSGSSNCSKFLIRPWGLRSLFWHTKVACRLYIRVPVFMSCWQRFVFRNSWFGLQYGCQWFRKLL